jgi:hypothetical protein
MHSTRFVVAVSTLVLVAGFSLGSVLQSSLQAQSAKRVFEVRTYTANPGKLDALNARFKNHTVRIFNNHSMTSVGYWTPQDAPLKQNTLIYILAHPSREAATKNWEAFRNDPEWQKVRAESEAQGAIVSKVDSVFVDATDYSPMK